MKKKTMVTLKLLFKIINTYLRFSNCSGSKLQSSSTWTPWTPKKIKINNLCHNNYSLWKDLPNPRINSEKTPGSDSIKHQFPASAIFLRGSNNFFYSKWQMRFFNASKKNSISSAWDKALLPFRFSNYLFISFS